MPLTDAILLGLLQGLTEFLPISSSAHLRIAGALMGSGDPGAAFTAVVQIGTEAAVLLYFRHDIWRIATGWLAALAGRGPADNVDARLGWLIILGTLPIAILGLLFKDAIETSLRDLRLTAAMLIGFGLLLGLADRVGARRRLLTGMGWRDGLLLGFAQAMALIPGVSRSGGTISAALLLGYTREAAARYAFLLAVPAVLASGFFELAMHWDMLAQTAALPLTVATLTAFFSGYGVIMLFLRFISTHSYAPFVYYRILLGTALLGAIGLNVIAVG